MIRPLLPVLVLLVAALAGCTGTKLPDSGSVGGSQPVAACPTCPAISTASASIISMEDGDASNVDGKSDPIYYELGLRVRVDNRQGSKDFSANTGDWSLVNAEGEVNSRVSGSQVKATAGFQGEGNLSFDLRSGPWISFRYKDSDKVVTQVPIPKLTWPQNYEARYAEMTVKSAVREGDELVLHVDVKNPIDAPLFKWCVGNDPRTFVGQESGGYDYFGDDIAALDCADAPPDVAGGTKRAATLRFTPPMYSEDACSNCAAKPPKPWSWLVHQKSYDGDNPSDAGTEVSSRIPEYDLGSETAHAGEMLTATSFTITLADFPNAPLAAGQAFHFNSTIAGAHEPHNHMSDHIGAHFGSNSTTAPSTTVYNKTCAHRAGALPGTYEVTCTAPTELGTYYLRGHARMTEGNVTNQWWSPEVSFRVA